MSGYKVEDIDAISLQLAVVADKYLVGKLGDVAAKSIIRSMRVNDALKLVS